MILHDFVYEWDGKARDGEKPVTWWPGAYHVRIVDLKGDRQNLCFLFPTAVILKNARTQKVMNTSLKNYIHSFAKKIAAKYGIEISKTMWVELDDHIRVAFLKPDPRPVPETTHSASWRELRPGELEMIKPYLEGM